MNLNGWSARHLAATEGSQRRSPQPLPQHLNASGADRWLEQCLNHWEKHPQRGWLGLGIAGFITGGIAFLAFLGSLGLIDETEPLFAEAARQMGLRQDWITPYFNGDPRFDKPPLIYWLMAVAYRVLGVNEWSVRLPSALSGLLLMAFVGYVLQQYGGIEPGRAERRARSRRWLAAFVSMAATALNLEVILWGRAAVSDMLLCGCFGAAMLCYFLGYAASGEAPPWSWRQELLGFASRDRWYLASFIWLGLAILAKGPVGIAVPGLIVIVFLAYTGQFWRKFLEMRPLRGLALTTAIALPWYILITQANGEEYLNSFFGYHNFSRFTATVNNHGAPWYFYFIVILVGFAPWSLYLPAAIQRLQIWRWRYWRQQPRQAQLGLYAFIWFSVVFGFFTIAATKLPSYILPGFPAAGILIGLTFATCPHPPAIAEAGFGGRPMPHVPSPISAVAHPPGLSTCSSFARSAWAQLIFLLVLAIVLFSGYFWLKLVYDPAMPDFPQAMQDSGLLAIGGGLSLAGAIAVLYTLRRHKTHWLWLINWLGFIIFFVGLIIPTTALIYHHRQLPLRQIAKVVVQQQKPQEEIIMVGFEKPTLVFYTQQPVLYFRRARSALRHIQSYSLDQAQPDSVLVVTYPERMPELGIPEGQFQLLYRLGAYQLVRVPKPALQALLVQPLKD